MKTFLKLTLLSLAAVSFFLPTISNAEVIYDFKGSICDACDGTEGQTDNIRGILTLSDAYIPGSGISETTGDGGNMFISFDLYQVDPVTLSILGTVNFTQDEYAIVAAASDPFFGLTAAGDGSLPSTDGSSAISDIYVLNSSFILNDYAASGGSFTIDAAAGPTTRGQYGFWTQRSSASVPVPEAASIAFLALGLFGVGFLRKKNMN